MERGIVTSPVFCIPVSMPIGSRGQRRVWASSDRGMRKEKSWPLCFRAERSFGCLQSCSVGLCITPEFLGFWGTSETSIHKEARDSGSRLIESSSVELFHCAQERKPANPRGRHLLPSITHAQGIAGDFHESLGLLSMVRSISETFMTKVYLYTEEYYLAIKPCWLLNFAVLWMSLEGIAKGNKTGPERQIPQGWFHSFEKSKQADVIGVDWESGNQTV